MSFLNISSVIPFQIIVNLDPGIALSIHIRSCRICQRINFRVEFHLLYMQEMEDQIFQIYVENFRDPTVLSLFTEAKVSFEGISPPINKKLV